MLTYFPNRHNRPLYQPSIFAISKICATKNQDSGGFTVAEEEGFEPPVHFCTTVFKTASLNHSDTLPKNGLLRVRLELTFTLRRAALPAMLTTGSHSKLQLDSLVRELLSHADLNCGPPTYQAGALTN